MIEIANDYQQRVYPAGIPAEHKLRYNDQSLRLGGKFDVTRDFRTQPSSWLVSGPHKEHKVGINCDVNNRNVPDDVITVEGRQRRRREVLEEIFCCHGSTRTLREFAANHWHLRFEFAYSGEGHDLCTVTDKNTGLTKTVKCGSLQNPAGNGAQDQASASSQEVWMCTPTPYNGVPAAVPGKVEAEEYDDDGDCDGFYVPPYYEPKPDDPDIVYNYPEVLPVDLNAPDKEEKVAMVGGEWINYTISVTVAGEYRFAARVASAVDGESFHVKIDGVNRTGSVIIPNTGSWDSYQMVEAHLGYLEAGRHVMRLAIEGNSEKSGHFDYYLLTLPPPCTDNDGDGYCSDVDCDDWDPLTYPGAPRDCSSWVDRDCDGIPDREECSFGGPGPILSLLDSFDRWFAFNSRLGADLIRPVSMRRRCR